MHPDTHLVRTRPPILDVPPLVWIDPPGAPKVHIQSIPLWEWPPPPRRSWRPALRVAFALVVTLSLVTADKPAEQALRPPLPEFDEPVWCACEWWPSGPARTLS